MPSEKVENHESYATASFSRVSGHATLFGTSVDHQHYITLSIKRAEKHRDNSRDWVFGKEELVEVAMSEAQFGALISSFNRGDGVPVTLSRFGGKCIPQPAAENLRAKFQNEFKKTMAEVAKDVERLAELAKTFQSKPSINKADRAVFASIADTIAMQLRSNVPFVTEQFNEQMDKTVAEAASEVEGVVSMKLQSMGLDALKDQITSGKPLTLETQKDTGLPGK